MQWTSVLAIYALLWVMCAFVMLPFGMRTHEEAGLEKIPGQADSAPATSALACICGEPALWPRCCARCSTPTM